MSKIGKWSTTAASNNFTPPDGWPEGQLPSTVNDCAREMMASVKTFARDAEWFDHDMTPTYVNANSFTTPGNQLTILEVGRKVKLYDGSSTIYRYIAAASYTSVTTVSLDTGTAITSSLSSFAVAIVSQTNPALPNRINLGFSQIGVLSASSIAVVGGVQMGGQLITGNGTTSQPAVIMDTVDVATGFYWIASGLIGFATNGVPAAKLSAGGFVSAAFTVSDERLKQNWEPLPHDFLERLAGVHNGTFEMRANPSVRHVGVGAQSLQQLIPEAIAVGDNDGYLAVQYGNAALAACVELAKEILVLRAEIKELKK